MATGHTHAATSHAHVVTGHAYMVIGHAHATVRYVYMDVRYSYVGIRHAHVWPYKSKHYIILYFRSFKKLFWRFISNNRSVLLRSKDL